MKNLKTLIAIFAISIASVLPASANTGSEPGADKAKTQLRTEIVQLLGNHQYQLKNKTLEALVSVMVNNQNELVVVDVNSKNTTINSYVKFRLNYKKIDAKGLKKGTVYRLPLKMVSKN